MYKDMELEFLRIFVTESREMIEEVEPQLIVIQEKAEQTGDVDKESINATFRLFHTLKGSAASLNLNNIASLYAQSRNAFRFISFWQGQF